MAAEQAKSRGNQLFAAGKFSDAIASFSEAIALYEKTPVSEQSGDLHVYYSNRSACYLSQGDARNALVDAEKCVSLKREWAKGYSRKGHALYALNRFTDAFRAYKDGLAIDPTNAALLEGLDLVQQRMASASSSSASPPPPPPSSSSSSSSFSSSSPASGRSLRAFLMGSKTNSFQLFQFVLRSIMVVCFLGFWIPIGLMPPMLAFGTFFKVGSLNQASYLAFTHGTPKFNAAYGQRLVMDPTTQTLLFCLLFWFSSPHPLAFFPVLTVELVHWSAYLSSLFQVVGGTPPLVQMIVTSAVDPAVSYVLSAPQWKTMSSQSKWALVYARIPQLCANMEVGIGLALVLQLFSPARNFMLLLIYWQLMRVRYMISPQIRNAFAALNRGILSIVHHPNCPAVVGKVYAKVQVFAAKMTDVSQQQQQQGATPRCSVM